MKILVPKRMLRRILRSAQYVLLSLGVALLSYCALVLLNAYYFQQKESRQLAEFVSSGTHAAAPDAALPAGLVGKLDIQRLGLSAIVMEGTSAAVLEAAAGHIPGTALPGQSGNVGIAAHRDTFFRPLRNIRRDDVVTLATPYGGYRYRVVSVTIVNPADVAVLNQTTNETLTLVTCYPFYYIGAAPRRFIVRAERAFDNVTSSDSSSSSNPSTPRFPPPAIRQ